MDPSYNAAVYGTPTTAQKAAFSTADFSRDFAGTISEMYVNAYGEAVSPAIKKMAETYPHLGIDSTKEPVTQIVAEQSVQPQAAADELIGKLEGIAGAGITWITNNLLIVLIAGAAIFVLPSLIGAAMPGRPARRRR